MRRERKAEGKFRDAELACAHEVAVRDHELQAEGALVVWFELAPKPVPRSSVC